MLYDVSAADTQLCLSLRILVFKNLHHSRLPQNLQDILVILYKIHIFLQLFTIIFEKSSSPRYFVEIVKSLTPLTTKSPNESQN